MILFSFLSIFFFGSWLHAETISGELQSHWLQKNYEMVVYVEKADGGPFLMPKQKPSMNQVKLVYSPHILPIVKGWEVEFRSEDKELHNLLAMFKESLIKKARQMFNLAMPPGVPPRTQKFGEEGLVNMLCSIHKEMNAYILVLQNPYFGLVKQDGLFKIEGIPPGRYNLKVWGEKLKEPQLAKTFPVELKAGASTKLTVIP